MIITKCRLYYNDGTYKQINICGTSSKLDKNRYLFFMYDSIGRLGQLQQGDIDIAWHRFRPF